MSEVFLVSFGCSPTLDKDVSAQSDFPPPGTGQLLSFTDNTDLYTLVLWFKWFVLYDVHCASVCVETNQNILIKTCGLQKQLRIVFIGSRYIVKFLSSFKKNDPYFLISY